MHRTCHTSVYMSCSYMQCAWRDSVDPGTELSITPCSAILKHICVKRKLPCFTANLCGKQCQAAKWKKWQRWSWVVFFLFFTEMWITWVIFPNLSVLALQPYINLICLPQYSRQLHKPAFIRYTCVRVRSREKWRGAVRGVCVYM